MAEKTYKPLLIDSVTALADLKQHRFVGLDVSSIMFQTGLCYEEYLEIFGAK